MFHFNLIVWEVIFQILFSFLDASLRDGLWLTQLSYFRFRSNTVSPSESYYQSSPEKRSSASGSEGSSPATPSGESPSPTSTVSCDTENLDTLTSTSLHKQFTHSSRDGKVQLQIITQPEQQHRARYQTEGSRGAVKDRSGNGFPVVKLNGYNKPATLQVGELE